MPKNAPKFSEDFSPTRPAPLPAAPLPDGADASTPPDVAETVEAVFGCKWSLRILRLIRSGVRRPGAIERSLEGLTTKVQHYYFQRMVNLGILERQVFAEVPPRVEYHLTPFGERFLPILDAIERLQQELTDRHKPDG
jgi:DNA-binding HxlR family transcriptional regulator